uniref:Uncharacterized protein n=1 Tax=Arundo donax TaxID=35708 RepID=A0A0A8Y8Z2_ARUDO
MVPSMLINKKALSRRLPRT